MAEFEETYQIQFYRRGRRRIYISFIINRKFTLMNNSIQFNQKTEGSLLHARELLDADGDIIGRLDDRRQN